MNTFTIVCRQDSDSKQLAKEIKMNMEQRAWTYNDVNPDLIVCVGGDGTLLKAFHDWKDQIETVSFIGIHTGTLGFSTDYTQDEVELFYKDIETKPTIEEKRILEVCCHYKDHKEYIQALNEVRVENIIRTQMVEVYLNEEYFETFRGNGMCISGQYGSTAYNRSIGGAVIYPGLDLLQMTEISGIHHRHSRSLDAPLILDPETIITFKSDSFAQAKLCYDHLYIPMDDIHEVCISSYAKPMRFAHFRNMSHIKRLNALF